MISEKNVHSLFFVFDLEIVLSKLKPTNELNKTLNNINNKDSLKNFINHSDIISTKSQAFVDYFFSLPDVQKIGSSVIRDRCSFAIEYHYYYEIKRGNSHKKIGRDKILALCLSAELALEEVNRCLKLGGVNILYSRNRRDAIIIYAIKKHLLLNETNELLDDFNQPLIKDN